MKNITKTTLMLLLGLLLTVNLQAQFDYKIIAQKDLPGIPEDFHVIDNKLYVVGSDTYRKGFINIYDISNISSPTELFSVTYNDYDFAQMEIDDDKLFIVGATGLHIFDFSNPIAPSFIVHHEKINDWTINNTHNEVIAKSGNLLFVSHSVDRLICMDISDVYSPIYKDDIYFNWSYVKQFKILSATTGVLDDGYGLRIVDFSNPSNLLVTLESDKAYMDYTSSSEWLEVNSAKTMAYVSSNSWGENYLTAIDLVSNTVLGTLHYDDIPDGPGGDVGTVSLNEDKNLMLVGNIIEMQIFDISDPANMTMVKNLDIGGETPCEFHGDYIFAKGGFGVEDLVILGTSGSDVSTNTAPVVADAIFSINRNSEKNSFVGVVSANDTDSDDLTYHLIDGNDKNIFSLNSTSGELLLFDNVALSRDNASQILLSVMVSDGTLSDTALVTIKITEEPNSAPVVTNIAFSIDRNLSNKTIVGQVRASDAENDMLLYRIISGNDKRIFSIDFFTATILMVDSLTLSADTASSIELLVEVSDSELSDTAIVIINIKEPQYTLQDPVIANQSFVIYENINTDSVIGKVLASSPSGGILTYRIVSGNDMNAFRLDSITGALSVADSSMINYEKYTIFTLLIEVSEGESVSQGLVIINVLNVDDGEVGIHNKLSKAVKLFPNPASDFIAIDIDDTGDVVNVEIYNLQGQIVVATEYISSELYVGNLPKGLYTVRVNSDSNDWFSKLIIQ